MKKRILLVLKEEFADWEAAYLSSWILELGKGNYVVETVSLNKETDALHRRVSGRAGLWAGRGAGNV